MTKFDLTSSWFEVKIFFYVGIYRKKTRGGAFLSRVKSIQHIFVALLL